MALRQGFLHQRLFQHLLSVACTYTALLAHAKISFQIPHPVSTSVMHSFADCGIGYTFADTNIHDGRLSLLFSQNQLAVPSASQTILLALVLNKYLVTVGEKRIAVNAPVPVQHDDLLLIHGRFLYRQ
jgi:hypothetical protein